MRLIEVKEKVRISDEQARIQSSESDAREEEVLAWKHDVSFNELAIDYCILLYYNCKLRWTCFLVFIFYLYSRFQSSRFDRESPDLMSCLPLSRFLPNSPDLL